MLASSLGISSWPPWKPQHSNPNPNPLANQLWCIDFLTPPTPVIIPHRLPGFLESLMPLKNWCSIHARWAVQKQSEAFHTFLWHFFQVYNNFIAYRSSKVSDCIFEIPQLWQSGFSRVYSNCCYSCSFEPEIIKIGQSSHKMYSNKILNFQESTTILNACTKNSGNLSNAQRMCVYVGINVYLCMRVSTFTHTFFLCRNLMVLWIVWALQLRALLIVKAPY